MPTNLPCQRRLVHFSTEVPKFPVNPADLFVVKLVDRLEILWVDCAQLGVVVREAPVDFRQPHTHNRVIWSAT
jgi:hypothetical protein